MHGPLKFIVFASSNLDSGFNAFCAAKWGKLACALAPLSKVTLRLNLHVVIPEFIDERVGSDNDAVVKLNIVREELD
jgi:hypothetical protein